MNFSAFDLNLLRVLDAVLAERSATRAARRLHVTQSAVSNALARLRDQLGDPLVVRDRRGLVATPRALELQPVIAGALAELARAVAAVDAFDPATAVRQFTLCLSDNHQVSEAPAIAAAVARALPRCTLRVVSPDFLAASDGLATGAVDCMFAPPFALPPNHRIRPLFEERGALLVRRGHPTIRRTISAAQFSSHGHIDVELVLGQTGAGHRASLDIWKRAGLTRRVAMSVPTFTAAALVAARTDWIAALPERAAALCGQTLPLVEAVAAFPLPNIPTALIWHPRTDADPGAALFRDLIAATVARPARRSRRARR